VLDHVEIVFAARDLAPIQLCCEDAFTLEVRACEHFPQRVHDAASACARDGIGIAVLDGIVGWKITPPGELVARKHEAARQSRQARREASPGGDYAVYRTQFR